MNDFLKGYNTQYTGGSPSAGPSQSVLEAMGRDAARANQAGPARQTVSTGGGGTHEFSLKHTLMVLAAGAVALGLLLGNNALGGPEGLSIALAVPATLLLGYAIVMLIMAAFVGGIIGVATVVKSRWFRFALIGGAIGWGIGLMVSFHPALFIQAGAVIGALVSFFKGRKKA